MLRLTEGYSQTHGCVFDCFPQIYFVGPLPSIVTGACVLILCVNEPVNSTEVTSEQYTLKKGAASVSWSNLPFIKVLDE